ncbi:hypothetical protein ZIOFF_026731 [Zingiber officinale]|uniref:SHSP domain-containing protein n=1 Tax=Zingiber officinale TaxID=94328 RepID=A0A8J5H564_ZINOF|nr:hypothetical protein ZIOFF_026731 [Zingiber officinale]
MQRTELELSRLYRNVVPMANLASGFRLLPEQPTIHLDCGGVLQISGERTKEREEKKDKWHRVERSSGKFLRRFRLPENAKVDQVKASMENGVLTVTIPKEEVKKPEVKAIEISG